jgi:branched-chain amino acid transport system substrate-binding protein
VTHASPETDDLNALLAAIKRVGPDFVFGSYCGAPAVDFVQAYSRSGLVEHFPLVGSGFLVEDDVLSAQGSAALGVKSVFPWAIDLDIPENNAFITAYTKQTGRPPDAFAVLGFDTAQLILKAAEAVEKGRRWHATLRDALGHVEFASPRGRLKMNAQTHSTASPLYLREVRARSGPPGNAIMVELDPISELEAGYELSQGSPKSGWLNAYLSV